MYKIKNFRVEGTTIFMTIVGKKCEFNIELVPIDALDVNKGMQYCCFDRSGDEDERSKIINQLMQDNNFNDL